MPGRDNRAHAKQPKRSGGIVSGLISLAVLGFFFAWPFGAWTIPSDWPVSSAPSLGGFVIFVVFALWLFG
ncbi:hypothetical protein [Microvirga massiliensis]|uniref:hypothetical protein n=1 Tax=Microvirga massiliensis TaxID=1033741 RepID=UPI00062BAB20|nr:hypothetical protein [Microvirga massiliensis]